MNRSPLDLPKRSHNHTTRTIHMPVLPGEEYGNHLWIVLTEANIAVAIPSYN